MEKAVELIGRWVRARSQFEATIEALRSKKHPRTTMRPLENAAVANLNSAEAAMKQFWVLVNKK